MFLLYIKISDESAYYQTNSETIINSAKAYYKNSKEVLRVQAKNKYREISEAEKKNEERIQKKQI